MDHEDQRILISQPECGLCSSLLYHHGKLSRPSEIHFNRIPGYKKGFPGATVGKNPLANAGDSRDRGLISGSGRSPGEGEASKAPVRCHTLWQPAPPGTVRPLFPFRRLACLTSCEQRFPAWAESSSWRSFLRGCFPGVGADLGDPTHRGRQNQMDRSMLCRRSLVNCRGPAPADPGYSKQRHR